MGLGTGYDDLMDEFYESAVNTGKVGVVMNMPEQWMKRETEEKLRKEDPWLWRNMGIGVKIFLVVGWTGAIAALLGAIWCMLWLTGQIMGWN